MRNITLTSFFFLMILKLPSFHIIDILLYRNTSARTAGNVTVRPVIWRDTVRHIDRSRTRRQKAAHTVGSYTSLFQRSACTSGLTARPAAVTSVGRLFPDHGSSRGTSELTQVQQIIQVIHITSILNNPYKYYYISKLVVKSEGLGQLIFLKSFQIKKKPFTNILFFFSICFASFVICKFRINNRIILSTTNLIINVKAYESVWFLLENRRSQTVVKH